MGVRRQLLDSRQIPATVAQVHVIETLRRRNLRQQLQGRVQRAFRGVEERAEIDPVGLQVGYGEYLRTGEPSKIVCRRPHNAKHRLAIGTEFDFRRTGRLAAQHLHEIGGNTAVAQVFEGAMSALVVANAADEKQFVPKLVGVGSKVERRAAEILGLANHVPQNFANADDAQSRTPSNILP